MGISRDSRHKRRQTGGRRKIHQKKRKYELGRQPANTKLGAKRVHLVRCRGGVFKKRAINLQEGNFAWGSENRAFRTRILDVSYNATNNELVRTKTLTKNSVIKVDATPFKKYYLTQYGIVLGKETEEEKVSKATTEKREKRAKAATIDEKLEAQFKAGTLYAVISSRPGQCGRADGYILEGPELQFYLRKMDKKRKN